jgi:hypothetical protein
MRTWLKQPDGKNQCGQVAVAVIAGITLKNSIKLIGKKGCTATKDLAKALRLLGYKCPNRLQRKPKPILGLGHLRYPGETRSHWVTLDGDKIYDGIYGTPDGKVHWKKDWKITSYLPISK